MVVDVTDDERQAYSTEWSSLVKKSSFLFHLNDSMIKHNIAILFGMMMMWKIYMQKEVAPKVCLSSICEEYTMSRMN